MFCKHTLSLKIRYDAATVIFFRTTNTVRVFPGVECWLLQTSVRVACLQSLNVVGLYKGVYHSGFSFERLQNYRHSFIKSVFILFSFGENAKMMCHIWRNHELYTVPRLFFNTSEQSTGECFDLTKSWMISSVVFYTGVVTVPPHQLDKRGVQDNLEVS